MSNAETGDKADYSAAWKDSFPPQKDDGFDVSKFEPKPTIAERMENGEATKYAGPVDWAREFVKIPDAADATAEKHFPDEARDSSTKNAFRHALGTGRMAQMLGADSDIPIVKNAAAGAAKVAGYAWEALGAGDRNEEQIRDSRHDLNANAIGAKTAKETKGREALVDSLLEKAKSTRLEEPPTEFAKSPGYFTRTK